MEQPEGDLADRLAGAAHHVVLNRRRALELDRGSVRGLTIEIQVDRTGTVTGADVFIHHRISMATILAGRS